jgi:hypothetical protein
VELAEQNLERVHVASSEPVEQFHPLYVLRSEPHPWSHSTHAATNGRSDDVSRVSDDSQEDLTMTSGFVAAQVLILTAFATTGAGLDGTPSSTPDFTGTWTLSVARSDFGPFPAPQRRTDAIEHRDGTLKVTRREVNAGGQERAGEWTCTTDGTDCKNTMGRTEMRSSVRWEGSTLIVSTKTTYEGQDASVEDRWALSTDGHTLTISRSAVSPQGTAHQTFILERQ